MQHRFRALALLLTLGLLLIWQNTTLACSNVILVSSNSHFGMVHRIEAALYVQPPPRPKIRHLTVDAIKGSTVFEHDKNTCLVVTIGSEALAAVLKTKTEHPILSVLTRKNMFYALLREHQLTLNHPSHPITAIYLDQPFSRQIQLLQCLINPKDTRPIGVLLGPSSLDDQEALQEIVKDKNIPITTIYVNKFENPIAVLDTLLDETKVILAIPDNRIYNPKTSRGILLTAFHKRVPILGYSRTYVNNGALAAVYATTKQLAHQTAKQITFIINSKDKKLPPPEFPDEYTIAVNYQVARSLGLTVENELAIKQAMDNLDQNMSKAKS